METDPNSIGFNHWSSDSLLERRGVSISRQDLPAVSTDSRSLRTLANLNPPLTLRRIRRSPQMQRHIALFLLLSIRAWECAFAAAVQEQKPTHPGAATRQEQTLPDAPVPISPTGLPAEESANVSGTVVDTTGAAVQGARVSLTSVIGAQRLTITTGADGEFAFSRIAPGSYVIIAAATGFQQTTTAQFVVRAQQSYEVPPVVLPVAAAITDVVVRPTEAMAEKEMKAELKQRLFGVIPNFYTSYSWDAAPLNSKQKYSMAMRDTFDPVSFIGISLAAGIEQASNSFPGYGEGAEGYGKRWGARFADGRISDLLSHAVFPSLFHQDPRYFYQGSGSTRSRIAHAVSYAFISRSDGGRFMPNYSYFLGDICSGALSNAYYPPSSRGANLVFTNAAIGLAGRAGRDIALEFFSKRLTRNARGNGKPALNIVTP
jgi:hypothetical protein